MRLSGRGRRRANEWSVVLVAAALVLVAGPTLLLPRLTIHVWTGFVFTAALAVHLVLHRRSIAVIRGRGRARPVNGGRLAADGLRELAAVALILTSVSLVLGWPGETLHVGAGVALVPLAAWHALVHRRWIGRMRCLRVRWSYLPRHGATSGSPPRR